MACRGWPRLFVTLSLPLVTCTSTAEGTPARVVRPLSGQEKWKLSGLCERKQWLQREGMSSQLGPLAGNSIPSRMTEVVAADESRRIQQYKRLLCQRARGSFVLMEPSAGLHSKKLCATFLVMLNLESGEVLVWNEAELPGMVHEVSQQQAFDLGCRWARACGADETWHCVLLERPMGASKARAVIHYGQNFPQVDGARPRAIADAMQLPIGELAVAALLQVQRMATGVDTERQTAETAESWVSGRVAGSAAYQPLLCGSPDEGSKAAFSAMLLRHEASVTRMRERLREDGSQDMME